MRKPAVLILAAWILAAGARGQQPSAPSRTPAAQSPEAIAELTQLYQVDLVPTGTGFAVTKPVLEGDVWVFQVWPDRSTVRLAQSKVKKITPRTKQITDEVVYRIDLAPSGQIFSRDNPVLKGSTYTFHRWQGAVLMSLRQPDVKKITPLTGMELFKTRLQYFGPKPIGNLPMEGGTAVMPAEPAPPTSSDAGAAENWIYYGTPGIDDAWAPGSAVVAYPGDVPKAPPPN
jgi:hypothetical protein